MSALQVVAKQSGCAPVGGDQHVRIAVAFHVAHGQAAAHQGLVQGRSRLGTRVEQPAPAVVPEQLRRLGVGDLPLHGVDLGLDVAVGQYQVLAAVQVVVEEPQAEGQGRQGGLHEAALPGAVEEDGAARRRLPVEGEGLAAEVADADGQHAVAGQVGHVHAHAGPGPAGLVVADAGRRAHLLEAAAAEVAQQEVGLRVVGDHQVDAAVGVEVVRRYAHRLGVGQEQPGLGGDVGEAAVAAVAVEARRRARVLLGRGVRLALAVEAGVEVVGRRPLHVVGHQQVGPAVAVDVRPGRARRPLRVPAAVLAGPGLPRHPGLLRHVGEPQGPVLAQQQVVAQRRQVEVGVAVGVIVGGGHAHAVDAHVQAGPGGEVGEGPGPVVGEEGGGRWWALPLVAGPPGAVDEQGVVVAVAVEVVQRAAGAHGLGHPLVAEGAGLVAEGQAGGLRGLGEGHRRRRRRVFGAGVVRGGTRVGRRLRGDLGGLLAAGGQQQRRRRDQPPQAAPAGQEQQRRRKQRPQTAPIGHQPRPPSPASSGASSCRWMA